MSSMAKAEFEVAFKGNKQIAEVLAAGDPISVAGGLKAALDHVHTR